VAALLRRSTERTSTKGFFISIEGGDMAGKTTQAGLLAAWLRSLGREVVLTREPGGTPAGEAIREILLHGGGTGLTAVTEALLFAASRGQLVAEVVRPALAAGKIVIADRYVDSSLAYQALALGLPFESVLAVNEWATGSLWPDLTVLLDVADPAAVRSRPRNQPADRIEERREDFHLKVARAYRELARRYADRYVVVDALPPVEVVAETVRSVVLERMRRLDPQEDRTEGREPGRGAGRGPGRVPAGREG